MKTRLACTALVLIELQLPDSAPGQRRGAQSWSLLGHQVAPRAHGTAALVSRQQPWSGTM